jgi:hypothetical protein
MAQFATRAFRETERGVFSKRRVADIETIASHFPDL